MNFRASMLKLDVSRKVEARSMCCELISPVRMNCSSSARAPIMLILFAIEKISHLYFSHTWFVNCQGINRLELFWLESLELLKTL